MNLGHADVFREVMDLRGAIAGDDITRAKWCSGTEMPTNDRLSARGASRNRNVAAAPSIKTTTRVHPRVEAVSRSVSSCVSFPRLVIAPPAGDVPQYPARRLADLSRFDGREPLLRRRREDRACQGMPGVSLHTGGEGQRLMLGEPRRDEDSVRRGSSVSKRPGLLKYSGPAARICSTTLSDFWTMIEPPGRAKSNR